MTDWKLSAACKHVDPDIPFGDDEDEDETYSTEDAATFAEYICGGCPVREKCLDTALRRREKYGVFGGLTPEQRRQLAN